ncbi:hypothetical protein J7T55_007629 [Diaporthe amygdali]|uniref:uncharacterized protein n=1 Tax=Phomopsis amygdali TaxID=1214568 RepID=UPI0022FE46D1|nr:uncharacterized protein J7T55_007629 [Diaporthe amygdali]KAJ0107259.1 hypothetical protein J7T55_007629 [Diaporthe amygdali]
MSSPTVLIVGAGPVGLTTALGLHQSGVPPRDILVVDQRPAQDPSRTWSKAISMSASSLEVFRILGIADRFIGVGRPLYTNHFGGGTRLLDLNYDAIGTKYPFNMGIPQLRTEGILLQRCEEVGIRFSWSRRFSTFSQNETHVLATFQKIDRLADTEDKEGETIEATWLIGCDSTHSAVREAAGISFEGTTATRYTWLADGHCDTDAPVMLTVRDKEGKSLVIASGDGPTGRRLIGNAPLIAKSPDERPTAPNENEVRDWAVKVFGSHYNFHGMTWSSVVGNGMRIAGSFRAGRVFLSGDAAHQLFPSGGQGMNTGLVDATNLAWKLGAVITGKLGANHEVIERVLDSYTIERQTSAEAVAQNVRMQMQVLFEYTEDERAVSEFITEALHEPSLNKRWAQRFTGFGDPVEPYQLAFASKGTTDSIVGTRLTHIADGNEDVLLEAMKKGIFVLAAIGGSGCKPVNFGKFKDTVSQARLNDRVNVLEVPVTTSGEKWKSVNALLVRPDFRVAWVARNDDEIERNQANLASVLKWWFG